MASFFDFVSVPDMQEAAADANQRQVAGNLAVAPRLNLRSAFHAALQRHGAAQTLALGERRLALARQQGQDTLALGQRRLGLEQQKEAYEAGQIPWTTGIGLASGAVGVYGGYRANAKADADTAARAEQARQFQAWQNTNTASTARLVDAYHATRKLLDAAGLPKDATTREMTGL